MGSLSSSECGWCLTTLLFRYLAREKNIADHWYPSDSKAQARVDEYLEWQHLNTRMMCAGYFIQKFLIPAQTKKINEKDTRPKKKSNNK